MRKLSILSAAALMPSLAACGTATYTIETPPDAKTGQATVLQSFDARQPGDSNVVVLVYNGIHQPPGVNPNVDSTAFVNATAAEGGSGLHTVATALIPRAHATGSP